MQIFRSLEEITGHSGPSVATIGSFDGIHRAHSQLLGRVRQLALEQNCKSVAVTFEPHPLAVLVPERAPQLLTPPPVRLELLTRSGIDHLLLLPFTHEMSHWSPAAFVDRVLVGALQVRTVIIGENFRFGHRQAGNPELLRELGARLKFEVEIFPCIYHRKRIVSSSEIRTLLETGNIPLANRLLGHPFSVRGPIEAGLGIGRTETVPTLNLGPYAGLLPRTGVYITTTRISASSDPAPPSDTFSAPLPSVTNIGSRPTFPGRPLGVETHLLQSWDGPAPQSMELSFHYRLRDEKKFASPAALRTQILLDVRRCQSYFRRLRP